MLLQPPERSCPPTPRYHSGHKVFHAFAGLVRPISSASPLTPFTSTISTSSAFSPSLLSTPTSFPTRSFFSKALDKSTELTKLENEYWQNPNALSNYSFIKGLQTHGYSDAIRRHVEIQGGGEYLDELGWQVYFDTLAADEMRLSCPRAVHRLTSNTSAALSPRSAEALMRFLSNYSHDSLESGGIRECESSISKFVQKSRHLEERAHAKKLGKEGRRALNAQSR